MWNTENSLRGRKAAAYVDCYYGEAQKRKAGNKKLSCAMAMVLGLVVTLEIMTAGAMLLNIDFHGMDGIALLFAFMVLYFGVVALLTDR